MVRKPDVSVLSYQKWPANRKIGSYITVPPDLAVEVVSPNDTYQEVREKVADYLKADIPLIWVVNESTRQVEVYSKQEVKVLSGDDELTGGDVIPDFKCLVREIFADIPTE
jgi:Uma2 family endonuclease